MNISNLIIRSDDWDLRLDTQQYIDSHEMFKKRGLIETANIQPTQWGNLSNIPEGLFDYVKANKDSYDIQIHGWAHFAYDEMEFSFIVRDLMACMHWAYKYLDATPTIWYPPWNRFSLNMERAAAVVGLKIDNESNDIAKFIRETKVELERGGTWSGHSFYVHTWKADEMTQLEEALDLAVRINR